MSDWVIDAGDRDFETAVLERSKRTPIVVDFWAPWCGPCRTLGPLLERLATEQQGGFILARVNVDENPGLAQAFAVQSIPMVLGLRNGQIVSEFVGAQPEQGVREFLKKLLPSAADRLAATAGDLLATGKLAEAEAEFQRALQLDGRCEHASLGMATIHSARGQFAEALELLDRIPPGRLRQEADRLAAEIRIKQGGSGDEQALRAQIAANPGALEARFQLGQLLAAHSRYEDALREYLEIVRRDRSFGDDAARKAMLDIFDLLGSAHDLTGRYRSELAKVLFS